MTSEKGCRYNNYQYHGGGKPINKVGIESKALLTYNVVSEDDVASHTEYAHEEGTADDAAPDHHMVVPLIPLLQGVHDEEGVVVTHKRWGGGG